MAGQPDTRLAGLRRNDAGNIVPALKAGEAGRDFADAIGDRFVSRQCRWCIGHVLFWHGDLADSIAQLDKAAMEAQGAQ